MEDLDLRPDLPGVLGLSFCPWVRGRDRDAFEQSVRAQGFQDFRIVPGGALPPDPDGCSPILFSEPADAHMQMLFGRDTWADPERREALARARDTGLPALSGPASLYREYASDRQVGLLFVTPVYQGSQPPETPAERRSLLRGWVCCAIRLADWVPNTLADGLAQGRIQIVDLQGSSPVTLFDSGPTGSTATRPPWSGESSRAAGSGWCAPGWLRVIWKAWGWAGTGGCSRRAP